MASKVEQLLQDVTFEPTWEGLPPRIGLHQEYGYLTVSGESANIGDVTLLGFGLSGWQKGTLDIDPEFIGITDYDELPPESGVRTISRQGKGVGARLYNTGQALAATQENPKRAGLYAFTVCGEHIISLQQPEDATLFRKFQRVAQHAGKIIRSFEYANGDEAARHIAERAHQEYGRAAEFIILSQTVHGGLRAAMRRADDSPIPEALGIVRKPNTQFTRVGVFTRS